MIRVEIERKVRGNDHERESQTSLWIYYAQMGGRVVFMDIVTTRLPLSLDVIHGMTITGRYERKAVYKPGCGANEMSTDIRAIFSSLLNAHRGYVYGRGDSDHALLEYT